jgi:hypothetical protein
MKAATEIRHFDHAEWISKLKSFKTEILSLEGRLANIAATHKEKEVLARVEHFQNQFIVQKSNVNEIIHAVKMDEKELHYELISMPKGVERSHPDDRPRDMAEGFEKTMFELRDDFDRFQKKVK